MRDYSKIVQGKLFANSARETALELGGVKSAPVVWGRGGIHLQRYPVALYTASDILTFRS